MAVESLREACFHSLLKAYRKEAYIAGSLEEWRSQNEVDERDFRLAQEIALGTMRMTRLLDHLGKQLTDGGRLPAKLKEKALLRMALYQLVCMDKIPSYAAVNESVNLAKTFCHRHFASYLNASLKTVEGRKWEIPQGDDPKSLSLRLSYPEPFVQDMIDDYGLEAAKRALEEMNRPPKLMGRKIGSFEMAFLKKPDSSDALYIQNSTPVNLIRELVENSSCHPRAILDLCASPGGKTLLLAELYQDRELWANDLTPKKTDRLKENLENYGVSAKVSTGPGETFSSEKPFDLILLDVPCSNSGVLHKRAEARWRLTEEHLHELRSIQLKLLRHAAGLLSEGGEIWYMTCSILKKENEGVISAFAEKKPVDTIYKKTYLPDTMGADGGFGAILKLERPL